MKQGELLEKSKGLYHNVNKRKKAGTSRSKDHPEAPSPQDWKNAAKTAKESTNEGLAELAGAAERDHEVQMARAELYKIAKYAIKLHEILKGVSEAEGIEGWMQSKITKAADYMGSVYHTMDYDTKFDESTVNESEKRWKQTSMSSEEATKKYGKENVKVKKGGLNNGDDMVSVYVESVNEAKDTHCSDDCCGSDVKAEDCTCKPTCSSCNCNAVSEGKSPHKKGTKKYKKHMAAIHANGG